MKRLGLCAVLAALVCVGPVSSVRAALVAHWTFDADATDVAGGYNGALMGGAAIDPTDAPVGAAALLLAADGDYVQLPGATTGAGLNITGPITVAGWVKTTDTSSHLVGGYSGGSPYDGYGFAISGSGMSYWSPVSSWKTFSGAVTDDTWHHVVLTISGSDARYYVDGVLTDSRNDVAQPTSYIGTRAIGHRGSGGASPTHQFIGAIDDVRIYDHGVTGTEIREMIGAFEKKSIAVPNFSFELPALGGAGSFQPVITDWTAASGGVYWPTASDYDVPVPDGNQVAFSNSGAITSAGLGPLDSDTLYILHVDVGERNVSPDPVYTVGLKAGGTTLNSVSNANGTGPATVAGQFVSVDVYATVDRGATPGSTLQAWLNKESGGQANFDNVRLTAIEGAKVPIVNPGFEVPNGFAFFPTVATTDVGWQRNDPPSDSAGTFTPTTAQFDAVPDGDQVAFVKTDQSIWQDLVGEVLSEGYRYVLLADVGFRKDGTGDFPGYSVELLAGGQVLASDSLLVPEKGEFLTSVVTFTARHGDPLAGQPLTIRLSQGGLNGNQAIFDNIRLFAYQVPEPSAWALAGLGLVALGGYGARRRRRN